MAGETHKTTYRVETIYDVTDRASKTLGDIQMKASRASADVSSLKTMLMGVGGAVLAGRGLGAAKAAFIDFNSNVQDTKNQIAGMMALATKTSLADNIEKANRLYDDLRQKAMTLPGTTQEYVQMAGMITQPIMDAGLRMKDLRDLTIATVVGSKALRVESGAAARDIDQALRGQYHSVDVFTGKLLGAQGYSGEAGRAKFNALSAKKRASELMKAVNAPQIKELAAAQGKTFTGVMSTIEDRLQQVGGRVGSKLFGVLTREVENVNQWLEKNNSKIDHFANVVGDSLVTGFGYIKSAGMFLVDHAGTLISIAKAWAALKVGGAIGGSLSGLWEGAGGGKGIKAFLGGGASGKGILGAAGGLGLGGVLGVGVLAYEFAKAAGVTEALTRAIDPQRAKLERLTETMDSFDMAVATTRDRLMDSLHGGAFYAQSSTQFGEDRIKAGVLSDIMAGRGMPDVGGPLGGIMKEQWIRKRMRDANMDDDEISRALGGDIGNSMGSLGRARDRYSKRADNAINLNAQTALVDMAVGIATAKLGNNGPEMITQQKITNMLLQESIRIGFRGQFAVDYLNARAKQLADEVDPDKRRQARVNQTVNVNINQVTAKDPDRWVQMIDDYAARRKRNPTRARSSLARGL